MVKRNPMDDALADLMDAWMDMMTLPQLRPRNRNFAGIEVPSMSKDSIGDWEEKDTEVCITVDMPGIQKKDIELNVDKHSVNVTAKTEERDYGFNKKFTPELNPEKVTAKFNNGVLDIKIHKAEESKGKTIAIK
jgi:HSP20 family molecular chaperone IbpA